MAPVEDVDSGLVEFVRARPRSVSAVLAAGLGPRRQVAEALRRALAEGRLVTREVLALNAHGVRRQVRVVTAGPAGAPPARLHGRALRARREELGWSRRRLAAELGVDHALIGVWETADVPAAWAGPLGALLERAAPAPQPYREAQRLSDEALVRWAKRIICEEPGLTRARVTARLRGGSMPRLRAAVEHLVRSGQVLEDVSSVEIADGRVMRRRTLRCPPAQA